MSDVRFREARQNCPRKVEARDHGVARIAPELVVSGIEGGIEDERRQFDHAHAHFAQTGLISVTKEMRGRPQTSYALTTKGREAFRDHIDVLEQIVKQWKKK